MMFWKWVALALLPSYAAAQSAAGMTCSAQAAGTPQLASDAATALAGDLLVSCSGGTPTPQGATLPTVTLTVTSTSVNFTSRLLGGQFSETLLMIDEPAPLKQTPCETANGICVMTSPNGTGLSTHDPAVNPTARNIFQGVQLSATVIQFASVPLDPPGTLRTVTLRIVNLRVNATQANVPPGGQVALGAALSWTSPSLTLPAISNSSPINGIVLAAMEYSVREPFGAPAGSPGNTIGSGNGGTLVRIGTLRYRELLAPAFRRRTPAPAGLGNQDTSPAPADQNFPSSIYQTETGFYNHNFGTYGTRGNLGTAGLADFGSRLMATFTDIPPGVQLYAPVYQDTSPSVSARLTAADSTGAGPFSAVPPTTGSLALISTGGTGRAVWEILNADTTALENVEFGIYASFPAGLTAGPIRVAMTRGPISSEPAPSLTAPVPRVGDTSATFSLATFAPLSYSSTFPNGAATQMIMQFGHPGGFSQIGIINILINRGLNGGNACYLAYIQAANAFYLVTNDGLGLTGPVTPGSGTTSNSQCTLHGAGTVVTRSGNNIQLIPNLTFNQATFAGGHVVYTAVRDLTDQTSGWQPLGTQRVPFLTQPQPHVVSLTPAHVASNTATYTWTIRDATAGTNLGTSWLLINRHLDASNGCYIAANAIANRLFLIYWDTSGIFGPPALRTVEVIPGAATTVTRGMCRLHGTGSSISTSGTDVTVTVSLEFLPEFAGLRTAYVGAADQNNVSTGWHALGTLNVP